MQKTQTIVVGGGIIGLSIAWQLARRDMPVIVLERDTAGSHASRAAAGMLAATAEVGFEEFDLYALCADSLRRWPQFASDLEADSGMPVDYRTEGTMIVARDRDAAESLRRAYEFQREHGFNVSWLSRDEALDREPFLSPNIPAAVHAPEDHAVDNRAVIRALVGAIRKLGSTVREQASVVRIDGTDVTLFDGSRISGEHVVLAAGPWSRDIVGVPAAIRPPVRPVKGQILELRMQSAFGLEHVVRGARAYLVPRTDGRLIVGATSEEMGFNSELTAGGIWSILDGARELVPGIHDLPVIGLDVGLRPGSRDNQPIVGWTSAPGVYIATGHYRHGVLLSAVTAESTATAIAGGGLPDVLLPFSPRRFDTE